uniref:Uncharacterized protein n=1 Tax=Helianthus annuus TaxID=4232 RepID=A0A251UUX7_HELAN
MAMLESFQFRRRRRISEVFFRCGMAQCFICLVWRIQTHYHIHFFRQSNRAHKRIRQQKATDGPVLLMKDRPLTIDCKSGSSGSNGENLFVLSVSDSGIVYVWNMKTKSQVNKSN